MIRPMCGLKMTWNIDMKIIYICAVLTNSLAATLWALTENWLMISIHLILVTITVLSREYNVQECGK